MVGGLASQLDLPSTAHLVGVGMSSGRMDDCSKNLACRNPSGACDIVVLDIIKEKTTQGPPRRMQRKLLTDST